MKKIITTLVLLIAAFFALGTRPTMAQSGIAVIVTRNQAQALRDGTALPNPEMLRQNLAMALGTPAAVNLTHRILSREERFQDPRTILENRIHEIPQSSLANSEDNSGVTVIVIDYATANDLLNKLRAYLDK
jgi:hypothetical protein